MPKYPKLSNKSPYTFASPNNKSHNYYARTYIGILMALKIVLKVKAWFSSSAYLPLQWDNTNFIPQLLTENPTILLGETKCNKTKCNIVADCVHNK